MRECDKDTYLLDQILYELDTNDQCDEKSEKSEEEQAFREKYLNDYLKGDL